MTDNPNPRCWRIDEAFVDLESVECVEGYFQTPGLVQVWRKGSDRCIDMKLTKDQLRSLLDALMIYRSGR